jgi:hypothetical protein
MTSAKKSRGSDAALRSMLRAIAVRDEGYRRVLGEYPEFAT